MVEFHEFGMLIVFFAQAQNTTAAANTQIEVKIQIASSKAELAEAHEALAQASNASSAGAEVQKQSSETAAAQDTHADKLERTVRHLDMENRKLKLKLERADKAQV